MKYFTDTFKIEDLRVVGFYPYTSGTIFRILEQSHNYKTPEHDFLESFGNKVLALAEAKGCRQDNKIVIELAFNNDNYRSLTKTSNIFVGYYDNVWSIGLGVWQDEWLEKSGSNKHFD